MLSELALLSRSHDVFVVLVDAAFAFELPPSRPDGSRPSTSRRAAPAWSRDAALARMGDRVRRWQDEVAAMAKDADLDVIRLGTDVDRQRPGACGVRRRTAAEEGGMTTSRAQAPGQSTELST